ncbi:biotin--[acetyl-CoA-carboxylase] ligase [Clostridium senegalense]|uniref:biotin--[acetyl-CoA-carboxylase] ligase n=1 Tax=Clostridium senegalense TaxID=1465809 RepID=UPI00028A3DED|nr:biotin--[acetyl-CoA-carboxylase] ligase [Clostridium senegalense]
MKEKILKALKENPDKFLSGEMLSKELGITRAAIWKHINSLKAEGYEIDSVSKKGYKLIDVPDLLTKDEILPRLNTKYIGKTYVYYSKIDSTNKKAKELATDGFEEGTIVISEEQSLGRGRLGRVWYSPKGKGIWVSIILKPDIPTMMAPRITLIGAAAVHSALEEFGIKSEIKWPNDIILNNKKVCGILTEMSGEMEKLNYIVMGIGINVNTEENELENELNKIATSLKIECKKEICRKQLLCSLLNHFEGFYDDFKEYGTLENVINICKKNSILIGKEVKIISYGKEVAAKVIDIEDDGELIVKYDDGTVGKVLSGEVSVRGLYGYV